MATNLRVVQRRVNIFFVSGISIFAFALGAGAGGAWPTAPPRAISRHPPGAYEAPVARSAVISPAPRVRSAPRARDTERKPRRETLAAHVDRPGRVGKNPFPQWNQANAVYLRAAPGRRPTARRVPERADPHERVRRRAARGTMGNSEVGHQNIGAGRIVDQESVRITKGDPPRRLLRQPRAERRRPPAPWRSGRTCTCSGS